MVKNPPAMWGDLGLIPGLGRSPGGGHGNLLQYSCLESPYGQRTLVSYSPWGHEELDMTEVTWHARAHGALSRRHRSALIPSPDKLG